MPPAELAEGYRRLPVVRAEAVGAYTLLVLRNDGGPVGSSVPAASSALKKAFPKVVSMPITSPVLRISGPSTVSASGKRLNGSTASLMAT